MRASEIRDHIAHTLFEQLLRDGQIADFGHARSADGTGVLQYQHMIFRHIKRGIVNTGFEIGHVFEDDGGSAMRREFGRGGGVFDDRAIGRQIASQDAQSAFGE